MKKSKRGKEKNKIYSLRRKRRTENIILEPKFVLKDINKGLICTGIVVGWAVVSGHPHPAKLPTCAKQKV